MARIRTVKPSFFRHHGLYAAEVAAQLPLRLAFEGLWTAADREGRFKWDPPALKLDCLPFDPVDFAAALEALAAAGFIRKYEHGGKTYGHIPTWHQHQKPNARETQSVLPGPEPGSEPCTDLHVHTREIHEHAGDPHAHAQDGRGSGSGTVLPPNPLPGGSAQKPRSGKSPCPDPFPVTDAMRAWFHQRIGTEVPRSVVEAQHDSFLDWTRSKRPRYVDWEATWRNAMLRAAGDFRTPLGNHLRGRAGPGRAPDPPGPVGREARGQFAE